MKKYSEFTTKEILEICRNEISWKEGTPTYAMNLPYFAEALNRLEQLTKKETKNENDSHSDAGPVFRCC